MEKLNILKTTFSVGLKQPVKFLHVTDTHIVRDNDKVSNRAAVFDTTDEQIDAYWFEAAEYAKENGLPIVHTGDFMDYVTDGALDFVDKHLSDLNYILATGSHDYGHLIPGSQDYRDWRAAGGAENDAYKKEQMKLVAPHVKNNLYFSSMLIGGVNVVALDNSYLHITDGQLDALIAEVAKGYPVVVAMHIPIHTKGLQDLGLMPRENLCSTADEQRAHAMANNRPDLAENIRVYDDATWRAIEYIKKEPMIKLILTGHRHRNFEEFLRDDQMQIVTHATCHGFVREITII